MTGPRRGDVPWRTAFTERPFPEAGSDGTAAVDGIDALRAPDLARDATAAGSWGDDRGPLPAPRAGDDALASPTALPSLPPLVPGDDPAARAAVEQWMESDRAAHADEPAPQPYRVLPTAPTPRPSLTDRSPARSTPRPADDRDGDEPDDAYEDPQVRALREEREFEAQFGPWRAGAGAPPPMRRSTLVSPPVLLLAFVLLVVLYYALTT